MVSDINYMKSVEAFKAYLDIEGDTSHDGIIVLFTVLTVQKILPPSVQFYWHQAQLSHMTGSFCAQVTWSYNTASRPGHKVWDDFFINPVGVSSPSWTSHLTWWPNFSKLQILHDIPNIYSCDPYFQSNLLRMFRVSYFRSKHCSGRRNDMMSNGKNICQKIPILKWVGWPVG